MTEITSTVSARCSKGWLLFWAIGDYYTIEILKEPPLRTWKDHQKAVEEHKEHFQGCDDCVSGITRVRMELEQEAVADGP